MKVYKTHLASPETHRQKKSWHAAEQNLHKKRGKRWCNQPRNKLAEGTYILTSWRTIGWKEEVSWSTVQSAGMAATSCICPKANAASCASRLDASLIATKPRTTRHTIKFSSLLSLPLHQKVTLKKTLKNQTKTNKMQQHHIPKPQVKIFPSTKIRETLRKENLGGLQHRIKILNRTDRKTYRPTDRPTDRPLMRAWRGPSPFKLRRVKRARQRSEMGELGSSKSCCRNTSMSCCCCSIAKNTRSVGEEERKAFGSHWRRFWRILRAHYTTFEGTLCHFWAHIMPLLRVR